MGRHIIHTLEDLALRAIPNNRSLRGFMKLPYTMPSMDEFEGMTEDLYQKCSKEFEPDVVLGLRESGFYPSYEIARKYGCDIDFMKTSANYVRDIIWLQHFTYIRDPETGKIIHKLISSFTRDVEGKKVLVVDDESSSGNLLKLAKELALCGHASEVKTAVLVNYIKEHSDFYSVFITPFSHLTYMHLPSRRYSRNFWF